MIYTSVDCFQGVKCAVAQRAGSDAGSTSLGDSINLSEPDSITVVQPKGNNQLYNFTCMHRLQ